MTGVFVAKTKSGDVRVAATGASQSGVMRVPAIEAALKANWSPAALDGVNDFGERICWPTSTARRNTAPTWSR